MIVIAFVRPSHCHQDKVIPLIETAVVDRRS